MSDQNHKAIIIFAMYCCGKTYLYKNNKKYTFYDIDEIIDPRPDIAPDDYRHYCKLYLYKNIIKENLYKYDFILVPGFTDIMKELDKENIEYVVVYPERSIESYNEWRDRNYNRKTVWLWKWVKSDFFNITKLLKSSDRAIKKYELKPNQYLSDIIDDIYNEFHR